MGEVTLEMLQKPLLDMQAEQKAMRVELSGLAETVQSLARSNVAIQRELRAVKDRVTILAVAFGGDEPPLHT